MKKLALLGAAAALSTVLATPLMAQEATQEPGMIGFTYPNSHYLTGGYGVHTPYNSGRYPRMPYYRHVYYAPGYYEPGPLGFAGAVVGGAVGTAATIATVPVAPYEAYAYDPY